MVIKKISVVIILLLTINLIASFGLSSYYTSERPLVMAKGEKKVIDFVLQNNLGEEDILVKADIKKGKEFIKLKEDEIIVGAGTTGTKFFVEVKMPRNATGPIPIEIILKTSPYNAGAPVTLGVGAMIAFNAIPSDEVVEPSIFENKFLYIIGIPISLLILILLILLIRRKKKKKGKKKK
jgi:LPXTG-motif cell wall-anchored protein